MTVFTVKIVLFFSSSSSSFHFTEQHSSEITRRLDDVCLFLDVVSHPSISRKVCAEFWSTKKKLLESEKSVCHALELDELWQIEFLTFDEIWITIRNRSKNKESWLAKPRQSRKLSSNDKINYRFEASTLYLWCVVTLRICLFRF